MAFSSPSNSSLGWELLDDTNQLIQVSDLDFQMLYANIPARSFTPHADKPYQGEKCYHYMMGLDEQCPFCPMRQMKDSNDLLQEVDNGQQVFTVKTKRIFWDGKPAFVEYATDITTVRRAQQIFEAQIHALLESIPEAQGIFHFDLTADRTTATSGASRNMVLFETETPVDPIIQQIASFIPDDAMQKQFVSTFCRDALMKAYQNGQAEVGQKLLSFYDDQNVRWTKMTARLIMNPNNGHLEAIVYGMDISREQAYEERLATAEQQKADLLELTKRDVLTGLYTKAAFQALVESYFTAQPDSSFALIFLDLDHFKDVNNTFGHLTGDHVLRSTSRTLQRLFDADSYLSRFGGDEFCIFFPVSSEADLALRLEALRQALSRKVELGDAVVRLTASIGALLVDRQASEFLPLLQIADGALYTAKRNGRDQYIIRQLSSMPE